MYILPISKNKYSQNTGFGSKYKPLESSVNIKSFEKQLNKLSKDKNAKNMFAELSLIAGTLIAEFSLFASQNKDVMNATQKAIKELGFDKNENMLSKFSEMFASQTQDSDTKAESENSDAGYARLFEEKPERNYYLSITSHFPNLDEKYQDLLIRSLKEPDNDEIHSALDIIESTFEILTKDNSLKYHLSYFSALNERSNCLDDIAKNISSTVKNGDTPMYYLVLLNNGKITEENIKRWAKYENLSCDEFMMLKDFDEHIPENINKLKERNPYFNITDINQIKSNKYNSISYTFKLNFDTNLSLKDKLKTIAEVHEAIHGPISLKENIVHKDKFLKEDIQTELADNLVKDRFLEVVYNFVKFIKPSAVKNFNYTSNEVRLLNPDSHKFRKIKNACTKVIMNLNIDSPKVQQICDVINDDDIFGDIITTRHARLRLINRLVLKDNPNANLKEDCKYVMDILTNDINNGLEQNLIFSVVSSGRNAPQFYLKSSLGNFIKITLNNTGSIHTLFEDLQKEQRQNTNNNTEENKEADQ